MERRSITCMLVCSLMACSAPRSERTAPRLATSTGGATSAPMAASYTPEGSAYDAEGDGPRDARRGPREALLTASSVGDHDRRGAYLDFLERHPREVSALALDTTRRLRVQVVDGEGRALRGAAIALEGRRVGTSFADGIFDLYPGVLGLAGGTGTLGVSYGDAHADVEIALPERGDGDTILVRVEGVVAEVPSRLELAFLVDVTGSMEDELRYVNHEIVGIVERVRDGATGVDVRVGATFYRDREDSVPLSAIGFTSDVPGFARAMAGVEASGGGDYPEDLDAGLDAVLHRLAWSDGDAVRVVVLITDAPPQAYRTQFGYREAIVEAARRGIRVVPVAASGADRTVETLLRAMGTCTGAPYVFLTDDSGVGAPHLEADTDRVRVEHFSLLLARLLLADLAGIGMHEPGYGGVPDFAQ